MKLDEIADNINRIVAIVEKVPEQFKERTYDALLTAVIAGVSATGATEVDPKYGSSSHDGVKRHLEATGDGGAIKTKGRYHQFLTDKGVTEADVRKILELEGSEVIFKRTPSAKVKAHAQVDWALLLALANGLAGGNLTVSGEDVRKRVQEEKIYDGTNFAKTFRVQKAYFIGSMGSGDPARRLSSDGEDALVALIKVMAT